MRELVGCLLVALWDFRFLGFYSLHDIEVQSLTFKGGSEVSRDLTLFLAVAAEFWHTAVRHVAVTELSDVAKHWLPHFCCRDPSTCVRVCEEQLQE